MRERLVALQEEHGDGIRLARSGLLIGVPYLLIVTASIFQGVVNRVGPREAIVLAFVGLGLSLLCDYWPEPRALAIVHKLRAVMLVALVFLAPLLLRLLAEAAGASGASSGTPPAKSGLVVFIVDGFVVGFLLRFIGGRALTMELLGRPKYGQRMYLGFAVTAVIVLLPGTEIHRNFRDIYLLGATLGLFSSDFFRRREAARAEASRVRANLREQLGVKEVRGVKPPPELREAEAYLASKSWSKLERFLASNKKLPRTWRTILRATMWRSRGDYSQALNLLSDELESGEGDSSLAPTLHLLLSLNLSETGNEKEMIKELRLAREGDPDCPVTKLTLALRMLESPRTAKAFKKSDADPGPLELVRAAMSTIEGDKYKPAAERRIVARAVPIKHVLLMDAYGYALLHAGMLDTSRVLLSLCIHEDPRFANAYLHLGEWMLAMRQSALEVLELEALELEALEEDQTHEAEENWRFFTESATFLFLVAAGLERKRNSLIARRARQMLKYARVPIRRVSAGGLGGASPTAGAPPESTTPEAT